MLAYTCNRDEHRAAALFIRNKFMEVTRTHTNMIDEEKHLTMNPSDLLPDAMKDEPSDA